MLYLSVLFCDTLMHTWQSHDFGAISSKVPLRQVFSLAAILKLLNITRFGLSSLGGRSFSAMAPKLWKSLSLTLRGSSTLFSFKSPIYLTVSSGHLCWSLYVLYMYVSMYFEHLWLFICLCLYLLDAMSCLFPPCAATLSLGKALNK